MSIWILVPWPGVRVHGAVYYTSIQSSIILLCGLSTLGFSMNFDWLVQQVKCTKVSTTKCNLQKELLV